MAFDAFLVFKVGSGNAPEIKGETRDDEMKKDDAFEINSFAFGAENTLSIGSKSGGAGAGKATFKEFTVSKQTDKGSPGLFHTCCVGGHYETCELHLRKAAGDKAKSGKTFLKFTFKLVAVKSISWSGSSGDDVPAEEVVFEYGAMQIEYSAQKPSGDFESPITFRWSRVKNKDTLAVD